MAENDKNRIEDVKRHLYDREGSVVRRREGVLHPIDHPVRESWQGDTKKIPEKDSLIMKKPPTSGFKKFFIASIIFFVIALGFAGLMYFNGGASVSNDNIDLKVLGNAFTKGGEELALQIEITNRNQASLELADLLIEYPRGAENDPLDVIRLPREKIGTIKAGESITRNIKVTLFGDERSVRNVAISLEYHPEGSNAIFVKKELYPVTISSAPLSLVIQAPAQATSEQEIALAVTATLNTTLPEGKTMLQLAYPGNFVFESAVPAPLYGNSIFSLESLSQAAPITVTVKGRLIGQNGDEQVFHAYAGTTSASDQSAVSVVYTSLLHAVTLAKPFLEAHILVDNQDLPTYTASGGEAVTATIEWANNLSNRITDAQIIVTLSGNAYDKTTVDAKDGFFDSAKNQIIWDRNTTSDLGDVEPGGRGAVSFSFRPISLVGTTVKDPQVFLDVSIRGRQPTLGSTFDNINNFAKKTVKIVSDFQIASSAVHKSGPLPPKAESQTQYTVTWTLSNSANNVLQAQARSVLPTYVTWIGKTGSVSENVSYNDVTREVIWTIGTVKSNTGFSSNREASFTIALNPSLSQVGSVPQLMRDINLTGTDSFTQTLIKARKAPITTVLTNDPIYKIGDERVVQ
ncbi:MAG: hypothetical protein V4665_02750 [Patescibacteria group bacterium]